MLLPLHAGDGFYMHAHWQCAVVSLRPSGGTPGLCSNTWSLPWLYVRSEPLFYSPPTANGLAQLQALKLEI